MTDNADTQRIPITEVTMFSLISLYFAYRRDVVTAERYVAALHTAAPADTVVADIRDDEQIQLPLAA